MMKNESYWNLFEKTGNINDYLNYACTSEQSLSENRIAKFSSGKKHRREHFHEYGAKLSEEGGHSDKSGNHHRNGSFGYADW